MDKTMIQDTVDRIGQNLTDTFGDKSGGPQDRVDERLVRRLPRKEVRKAAKMAGTAGKGILWQRLDSEDQIVVDAVYPSGLLAWLKTDADGWVLLDVLDDGEPDFKVSGQVMVQGVGYFKDVEVRAVVRDGVRRFVLTEW